MLIQNGTSRRQFISVFRAFSLVIGVTFNSACIATGGEGTELLIVHQQTELVSEQSLANTSVEMRSTQLKGGTTVVGLRKDQVGQSGGARWLIKTSDVTPQQGWVSANDVTPFSSYVSELQARAIASRSNKGRKLSSLPDLILIQNNPAIRKAWERVADVIAENEKLPVQERLPEPYFARAEIWSSVKNYFAALQDYLTGIKCARNSGRDVSSYSPYFDKLAEVARNLESNPVPATGAVKRWPEIAQMHYGLGFSDYFSGAYQDALAHFSNSASLAPDEALYWYFRALTHRALGEPDRARHDALLGAYFEKNSYYHQRQRTNSQLSRVQGPDRSWLENHRAGMVMFHLVGESLE